MMSKFLLGLLFLLQVNSHAFACLWDRDTLRAEARGVPGIVEVITGRFERNPPEFYSIRLARVEKELVTNPTEPRLYDDAGVACDRLGRGKKAIVWMERKRQLLDQLGRGFKDYETHLYRYHANMGTFRIHHWMREGAERDRLTELEQARADIAEAIRINPGAHFAREKYQLMAMDWIYEIKVTGGKSVPSPAFISKSFNSPKNDELTGIGGLIVLGNGWESVDIFAALFFELREKQHASLALLAKLRIQELQGAGERSISGIGFDDERPYLMVEDTRPAIAYYKKARDEAERWQQARHEFMAAQFARGLHPDTDKKFWDSFSYTAKPPVLPN